MDNFEAKCTIGKEGKFTTRRGLLRHCQKAENFHHQLLHYYLTEMYDINMELVGQTERQLQEQKILEELFKIDERAYRNQRNKKTW